MCKKMDKVPMVTWKDAFRLYLNHNKTINGQNINGPLLTIVGITADEITDGYVFLVTLTSKILYGDCLRNLEEKTDVKTICIIKHSVDRTNDSVNLVEYEYIGNRIGKDYYKKFRKY